MTFLQTHDHDGHAVLCHNNGNGDAVFAIFEKCPSSEQGTVKIVTEEEAIAYRQKHTLKTLSIVHSWD